MTGKLNVFADKCTGCRLCELACSMHNAGTFNPGLARIRVHHQVEDLCTPVACTQCEEESCILACPMRAIERDAATGVVLIDLDACDGCAECVEACPYGAMGWNALDETPFKCDECGGQPVCVPICPSEALAYGQLQTVSH